MFPGTAPVVIYIRETGKRYGTACEIRKALVEELQTLFGQGNVIVK
jgi:hypothetical protein